MNNILYCRIQESATGILNVGFYLRDREWTLKLRYNMENTRNVIEVNKLNLNARM